MGEELNLKEWRLWRGARNLVQLIDRHLPEVGVDCFQDHIRRESLLMLCAVSESRMAGSPREAVVLLSYARNACREIRHMFRSQRYYRYMADDVAGELDIFCKKFLQSIGREIQKIKEEHEASKPRRKSGKKGNKDKDAGEGAVKGQE